MKNTGFLTYDSRRIVHLNGPMLPPGGLYRVAYGTPGSDVGETFDTCCTWCGETPGRVFCYFDSLDEAVRNGDAEGRTDEFCSLHCWGQHSGYTDL